MEESASVTAEDKADAWCTGVTRRAAPRGMWPGFLSHFSHFGLPHVADVTFLLAAPQSGCPSSQKPAQGLLLQGHIWQWPIMAAWRPHGVVPSYPQYWGHTT
jgi:hypothetical protein